MQNSLEIKWPDVLEAFYGVSLTARQVEVWEHFLIELNPTAAELIAAVRMAADESIKPTEWRVTVRDLMQWLKKFRAVKRNESRIKDQENKKNAFISCWRDKLSRGADKNDLISAVDETFKLFKITDRNEILDEVLR